MLDKRFIEVIFPIEDVSKESVREKNIRHGHISTLHIWWARRPLASSRATIYASLIPAPKDKEDAKEKNKFISKLAKWENPLDKNIILQARNDILQANNGNPPRVLDPFAGGGSIPLEALRLGCEVYAGDYNPVATLILKCTLEYPQKYCNNINYVEYEGIRSDSSKNRLLEDIKRYGNYVLEEAKKELARFYPNDPDGSIPVGYIWARTIPCQNPSCNAEIPLMRQYWLARKSNRKIALYPYVEDKKVKFKIVGDGYEPIPKTRYLFTWEDVANGIPDSLKNFIKDKFNTVWIDKKDVKISVYEKQITIYDNTNSITIELDDPYNPTKVIIKHENKSIKLDVVKSDRIRVYAPFDPSKGSIKKAKATCLVCNTRISDKVVRRLFKERKNSERLIAVVLYKEGSKGKKYRIANENDLKVFKEAEEYLIKKRRELMSKWSIDPIPDEELPPKGTLGFRVQSYRMIKWSDLFNSRQKLALITFTEKVRLVYQKMLDQGYDEEYARAVVSYLALCVNRSATYLASLVRWRGDALSFERIFDRQALGMVWDYGEVNPFSDSRGCWDLEPLLETLLYLSQIPSVKRQSEKFIPIIKQASSTKTLSTTTIFDAVFTDPPYYDNVPYSYLSDFFYVWLKRSIGELYPELFATPLTPKSEEIVAYTHNNSLEEGKKRFEELLSKAFKEIHRVLKPNGIAVIVYAHKSTSGWETLINSLLDSGLVITAAWPIHTEMEGRLRGQGSAALRSSIYIVARKFNRESIGFYRDIKNELKAYLNDRLEQLWREGIAGADFILAAIGSSIQVFGKYEKIMDDKGNIIRADRLIDEVRNIVIDYAIKQVLRDGFSRNITELTRFYILYRWAYKDGMVHFDDAKKLAQGIGVDISKEWSKKNSFIKKDKEYIRLLSPHERNVKELKDSMEMIDILHLALLLWKDGKDDELLTLLQDKGYIKDDTFYRVAQAIASTLPDSSSEKKLLEGLLAGKERYIKYNTNEQKRIDEY